MDIVNYLVTEKIPSEWTSQQNRKFLVDIKKYYFDDPYLFKYCLDQLMRRCVSNDDQIGVLTFRHSEACGGHFSAKKRLTKSCKPVFIGPLFLKIALTFAKSVLSANN